VLTAEKWMSEVVVSGPRHVIIASSPIPELNSLPAVMIHLVTLNSVSHFYSPSESRIFLCV